MSVNIGYCASLSFSWTTSVIPIDHCLLMLCVLTAVNYFTLECNFNLGSLMRKCVMYRIYCVVVRAVLRRFFRWPTAHLMGGCFCSLKIGNWKVLLSPCCLGVIKGAVVKVLIGIPIICLLREGLVFCRTFDCRRMQQPEISHHRMFTFFGKSQHIKSPQHIAKYTSLCKQCAVLISREMAYLTTSVRGFLDFS